MKGFLFDQNVPARIIFQPALPVTYACQVGKNPTDSEIWQYAQQHYLAIVTKDADFSHRAMLTMPPPWVVHLRFGNMRRGQYHLFLARVWPRIENLLPQNKLVTVFSDRIEAIAS